MKKFWQWLRGQWLKPTNFKLENWIYLPLMVFFYLMVACLLFLDLGIFIYKLIKRYFVDLSIKIQKKDWPNFVKAPLTMFINWSLSIALIIMIALIVAVKQLTTHKDLPLREQVAFLPVMFKPEVIEELLPLPNELKFASTEALVKIDKEEIENTVKQAEILESDERQQLSQKEMLNVALAYYYLGDQTQYQQWLEWGRELDPNESYFK